MNCARTAVLFSLILGTALAGCTSRVAHVRDEDPFAKIARGIKPSVALITAEVPSDDPKARGEWDEDYGSSAVIASDRRRSLLVTAAHAIDGARRITVTLGGKRLPKSRMLVEDAAHDLAVVEVAQGSLPVLRLAEVTGLESGDPIGLAGFPIPDAFEDEKLGVAVSIYAGRLASLRPGALELDLPVIPGESGGPVFDARTGDVIGIAESRFDEERAIGFAVPVQEVARLLKRALAR